MTHRTDTVALPAAVERALNGWASPPEDSATFARQLESTLRAVEQTEIGSTSDSLLQAPDFSDLDEEASGLDKGSDDGVELLGQLSEPEATETRFPLKSGEHVRVLPNAASAKVASIAEGRTGRGRLVVIGTCFALAAAAAAVMVIRSGDGTSSEASLGRTPDGNARSSNGNSAEKPTPPNHDKENPALARADHDLAGAESDQAISPASLPLDGPVHARGGRAKPRVTPPSADAPPSPVEPDLSGEPVMMPAAGPSVLPDHPATGAIQASLARGLARAQGCLGSDPVGPSSVPVTVTFGSAGGVERVEVAPGLVDSSVESCIRASLRGAKVAPFARTQFTATTAVSRAKPTTATPVGQKP